jgi:hypothetical protein
VHCCHGVHFTSTPQNINPHQMRILKTSFNQWTLWVNWSSHKHTMIINLLSFRKSYASIGQDLCNVQVVAEEADFLCVWNAGFCFA